MEVVSASDGAKAITIYRLSREDIERMLAAKFGEKLAAVNKAKLAKQHERRANWLKRS